MTTTDISASKEYQVLQKYYGKLIRAISDPVILAADLFASGLISDLIRMKATNENDWLITRNDHLLNGIIGAIVCDSNNLMTFISILEVNTPLDSIAHDMKTDYESPDFNYQPSVTHGQSHINESVHEDLNTMQRKLGALVLDVQKATKSANVCVDELKQLLILSYPFGNFKEEIKNTHNFLEVFVVIRKHCSPVNTDILTCIGEYFKLADALTAIQTYEAKGEKEADIKKTPHVTYRPDLESTDSPDHPEHVSGGENVECVHSTEGEANNSAIKSYTPTWRELSPGAYDLLIIGSFGQTSDSLSIQVAHKLIPSDQEGSNQWMTKEIDFLAELHKKSSYCKNVLVCSDIAGTQHSKGHYLKKIKKFFIDCISDIGKRDYVYKLIGLLNLAVIHYTGHGEKNTGNWCFKNGVITFQDIFDLYMDCFRGKRLTIHSDCSYSGNWIKDCVKILDDLGIPSCGHHTRKEGILLRVFCSCRAYEEATALCYITEANEFDEKRKLVVTDCNETLSSGQTTKLGDFIQIRCSKTPAETCETDSTCIWEDRIFRKGHRVYLVHGKENDKQAWYYILVNEDKLELFKNHLRSGIMKLAKYGIVLYSGWGQDPPQDIVHKVDLKFKQLLHANV